MGATQLNPLLRLPKNCLFNLPKIIQLLEDQQAKKI